VVWAVIKRRVFTGPKGSLIEKADLEGAAVEFMVR
jgi:hypothetical protein